MMGSFVQPTFFYLGSFYQTTLIFQQSQSGKDWTSSFPPLLFSFLEKAFICAGTTLEGGLRGLYRALAPAPPEFRGSEKRTERDNLLLLAFPESKS